MQNEQLSALVTSGNGVVIWDFISQQIDLRSGVVQDKLQVKFDSLRVGPTDSVAYVSSQVDLKWFLYKHHALYSVATEAGRREGVRSILKMLLNGPGNIATEAILALSQVEMFPLTDPLSADAWVTSRLENYKRYGEMLASQGQGGQHYQMYPEEDEAYLWVMSDSDKEAKWAKYQHITRCGKCNIFNCPGGATCVLVDPTICLMGAIAPVVGIASLLPTKPYHQGLGHSLRPPGIVELHAHPTRSESSILTFNMIELPAPPARTHTDVPPPRADHNFCAHPQAHQLATRHPPE